MTNQEFYKRRGGYSPLFKRRIAMAAIEVMAEAYDIPLSRLTMATRQRASVALARQIAMYLAHVIGQMSLREVAKEFDREVSTVSYACHVIEDKRDNELFDDQVSLLEEALRGRLKQIIEQTLAAGQSLVAPASEQKNKSRSRACEDGQIGPPHANATRKKQAPPPEVKSMCAQRRAVG